MFFLKNLFAPKWKLAQILSQSPSTSRSWVALIVLKKGEDERQEVIRFKHAPSVGEVKRAARQLCKTRNAGGDKDAFNLTQGGKVVETLHGKWTDASHFEITERIVLEVKE